MNPVSEIRERLAKYPDVQVEQGDGWIRCLPRSDEGFIVELRTDGDGYAVFFDGWHEHFGNAEEALNCFAFGLSDRCRLKILSRGGTPQRWIVESYDNGRWVPESETGVFLFRFWLPAKTSYRQNKLNISDVP